MKVAIVTARFDDIGGATGIARIEAFELKRRGYDVSVFTGNGKSDEWLEENAVSVYRIRTSAIPWVLRGYIALRNWRVERAFRKFLAEVRPDIVHFHNMYFELPFSLISMAKKSGAKVFYTAHDVMLISQQKLFHFAGPQWDLATIDAVDYHLSLVEQWKQNGRTWNPVRNICIRHYIRYVDRIITVSHELQKVLVQNNIGAPIMVIHNGIDADVWFASDDMVVQFKKQHGLGERVILFGGRISGLKGGMKIIEALALICKSMPDTQLLVVGKKDEYADRMLVYAHSLGVENNIVFSGWLAGDSLHTAYHAATVVTVNSLCFDSFPTINLEAMACGKPVVATCFGGSREAIQDMVTGYIVNPFNVSTLAERAETILGDTALARSFGVAGKRRVQEEFSINSMISAYIRLFQGEDGTISR